MRNITIKDIAKEAGVSKCTVSFALNDSGYVKKKTKDKIIKIAKKYNYRPSNIARAIRTKKTKNILYITTYFRQPAAVMSISGVEKRLSESKYNLIIIDIAERYNSNESITNIVDIRNYDGILVGVLPRKFIEEFNNLSNILIMYLHKYNFLKDYSYIDIDNYQGGEIAARYLLNNNHKKVGIVINESKVLDDYILRRDGFLKTLKSNGLDLSFEFYVPIELNNIDNFLSENKKTILEGIRSNKITALFVTTDITAIFLLSFLHDNGIKVPEDISLIGLDNIEYSSLTIPKLTTIDHFIYKSGYIAADNLINKIEKGKYKKKTTVFNTVLIERNSVKKIK